MFGEILLIRFCEDLSGMIEWQKTEGDINNVRALKRLYAQTAAAIITIRSGVKHYAAERMGHLLIERYIDKLCIDLPVPTIHQLKHGFGNGWNLQNDKQY